MPHSSRRPRPVAALALASALLASGCDAPEAALAPVAPSRSIAAATPRLLVCEDAVPHAAGGVVGHMGGVLDVGATQVEFPLAAVHDERPFSVAMRPGPYAIVDVHADGLASYEFRRSVTITIDLSHCPDISGPLTVWHMDETTGAFLENMGGVTDPVRRTITFQTPHLSIYAVAN